jgi:hypothetical protein
VQNLWNDPRKYHVINTLILDTVLTRTPFLTSATLAIQNIPGP